MNFQRHSLLFFIDTSYRKINGKKGTVHFWHEYPV